MTLPYSSGNMCPGVFETGNLLGQSYQTQLRWLFRSPEPTKLKRIGKTKLHSSIEEVVCARRVFHVTLDYIRIFRRSSVRKVTL
jgi:hypothetical protein